MNCQWSPSANGRTRRRWGTLPEAKRTGKTGCRKRPEFERRIAKAVPQGLKPVPFTGSGISAACKSQSWKLEKKEDVMALLERVSTLLRANLNDLVEKAEDPEKLLKQIVLDMENQLLQVKTQVAIAIADEHLLGKKRAEHAEQAAEWRRKAELAVQKGHDDLARAAP